MAKSLGAGMPIAAVTGRAELMDAPHVGGIGGTFGGAPVACAAAIEAVQMIREPEFLEFCQDPPHVAVLVFDHGAGAARMAGTRD